MIRISHELSLLRGDVNRLQFQIFAMRGRVLPLLKRVYHSNEKTGAETNVLLLSEILFNNVEVLSFTIDEYMTRLNQVTMAKPIGHGVFKNQQIQQFHGIKGDLNDKLIRLKKHIDDLLREMGPYRIERKNKTARQLQHETFELLDVIDYQELKNNDFVEHVDFVNATIALIVLIIKALRK